MTPTVLVTGASGGIGRALAALLGKRGWRVAAVGRDSSRLAELPAALHIAADVTTPDGAAQTLIDRWECPPLPLFILPHLSHIASAAIDISDGLLADLAHLCEASSVGACIDSRALPGSPEARHMATALGLDLTELSLNAGDDYQLLFAVRGDRTVPEGCTVIGVIEKQPGLRVVDLDGVLRDARPSGYEHHW